MWWTRRRKERLRQQMRLYRTLREYMTREQARFVLKEITRELTQ